MVQELDLTAVAVGLMTLLGGCAWFVEGRKHKPAANGLKADNRLKDMELGQKYVEQFEANIAEPLRREVRELRDEIKELKNAVEGVNDCAYRSECPVRERMRHDKLRWDEP